MLTIVVAVCHACANTAINIAGDGPARFQQGAIVRQPRATRSQSVGVL